MNKCELNNVENDYFSKTSQNPAKKIIISQNEMRFFYNVDGKEIIRHVIFERDSSGNIIAFTAQNGNRTEVTSDE